MENRASRHSKDSPWCWQSKPALRLIREQLGDLPIGAAALSVYDGLTEIASNEQAEKFTTTHPFIGSLRLLNAKTVQRAMRELERIGLVEIEKSANGPSTYRLLSAGHNVQPAGHNVAPGGHGSNRAPSPTSEESEKNPKKVKNESPVDDDAWLRSLTTDAAFAGIDVRFELTKAQRWCLSNRRRCTRRFFENWLQRADRPVGAGRARQDRASEGIPEPPNWQSLLQERFPYSVQVSEGAHRRQWAALSASNQDSIAKALSASTPHKESI